MRSARDDGEWEREMDNAGSSLKSGEIRITMNQPAKGAPVRIQARGAGIPKKSNGRPKATPIDAVPAIATKTVKAQDVYQAGAQQNNVGVELKSLSSSGDRKV